MLKTLGEVGVSGREFGRPKPLLLLTYLTLEGPQSRRHLAELFWPGSSQGRRSLTTAVMRLRRALPGSVGANENSVWSELDSDVAELGRVLDEGELERAQRLYEGPFLANLDLDELPVELEEWLYRTREAIAERLRSALLQQALVEWARGDLEGAARMAAKAYRVAGAAPLAPRAAARCHALLLAADHPLASEVAVEAGEYDLELPASSSEARELLQGLELEETPHLLPQRGGAFVGREVELAELSQSITLPDRRLLTLVGPGGMGKTRLALEVARRALLAGAFPDGVFFVGLEALRDAKEVPGAIADVLGLDSGDAEQALARLTEWLKRRRVLLVLDNVEQLPGVAAQVGSLLEACPHLTLLVTSRHRLWAAGEWAVPLTGLSFPAGRLSPEEAALFDAPRLFLKRARQAGAKLDPERDLPHVLRLCRSLHGAPLGLELAATWTQLLSCAEIATEVERSFDLLAAQGTSRQSSLRAVFEHSWKLLSAQEQRSLRRLSLARGGFTRELAQVLTDCELHVLLSLAGKSLIERVGDGRFRLLEITREYAFERLAGEELDLRETRQRFVRYFLELAREGEAGLRGDRQVEWLERLAAERDNLRAALEYSLEGDTEEGLQIAAALQMFWWIRGEYREGLERTEALLRAAGEGISQRVRAKALHRAGTLAQELGEYAQAQSFYRRALAMADEARQPQIRADALHSLGLLASKRGEVETATRYYEQCLELQRELDDRWGVSATLNNMGVNLMSGGQFERAREPLLESLELKRAMGEMQGVSYALHNLGTLAYALGDLEGASEYVERSLEIKRELRDEQALGTSYTSLGRIALRRGQLERARERLVLGLSQFARLENRWTFSTEATAAVALEVASGRPEVALRLAGFIDASCREMEMRLPHLAAAELEEGRRQARERLGPAEAERLMQEGAKMALAQMAEEIAAGSPGRGVRSPA